MSAGTSIHKAITLCRQEGIKAALIKALKRLARVFFETNSAYWLRRELEAPISIPEARIKVELDFSDPEKTISWMRAQEAKWLYQQKEIDTGLAKEHFYPSVSHNGRIIGCAKVGKEEVYISDYKKNIEFPSGEAFIYEIFVDPCYRNKGIASLLVAAILMQLKEKGFKVCGCHIPPWNKASLAVFQRMGFNISSYSRCLRILGFNLFLKKKA